MKIDGIPQSGSTYKKKVEEGIVSKDKQQVEGKGKFGELISSESSSEASQKTSKSLDINSAVEFLKHRKPVAVSNYDKEVDIAMNTIKELPDIDINKVEKLSELINSGKYKVSGEAIADKIINKARV